MQIIDSNDEKMIVEYDADDEDPKCGRCDNIMAGESFCERCGETGWGGYVRRETVAIDKQEKK